MISRDLTEPAVAAWVEQWHRGRESDPALAPRGVPDLSLVPGYSLDDVGHNRAGLQSPAQVRQGKKTVLGRLAVIGGGVALVAATLANGGGLVSFVAMIGIGVALIRVLIDYEEIRAGQVSQVDGDLWTEHRRDSEGPDHFFVHVRDLKLEITKHAFAALTAGGPYRIYYLPDAKRAVGGQVLPGWRPSYQLRPNKSG